MGTFFINDSGQSVGLCPKCNLIKPQAMFAKQTYQVNQFTYCYVCMREFTQIRRSIGDQIKISIIEQAGGCVWPGCHMRYPRDFFGNFELDHINPELKIKPTETKSTWIASNQEEFWIRVYPNLQVLCGHHHQEKTRSEQKAGGILHVNPWDRDTDEDSIVDFNEIAPVLPGMESFVNPLT